MSVDLFEKLAEQVDALDVGVSREWFYVISSILAWGLFWEAADRNGDNPQVQFITWLCVGVTMYLVCLC